MIYNEIANVLSNSQIAENIYKAVLYAPKISHQSKPGQFINILPHKSWSNVMRRPMSIASQGKNDISIIYKVFGEGTDLISKWKIDDKIDRESAIKQVTDEATKLAVERNADPNTINVLAVSDMPLSYLPGNNLLINVTVVGDLKMENK